ncbi:hypothetical protein ACUNV4_08310 [Granulosicoccus sp. 3-233]|uniref:hypothetical protein n=1 Tax=Granulosicoccus sp. 3-233 TaxID=3417969 RepID=UPI003D326FE8
MNALLKGTTLVASCLFLSACATGPLLEEIPLDADLPPVEKPVWSVGQKQITRDNLSGEESSWEVVSVDELDRVTARSSNGCQWTVPGEWFAGVERWENCGGSDGTRTLLESEGTLWPLQVGRESTYRYRLDSSSGNTRVENIKCQVASQGRVVVAQGEMDAFRVECVRKDPWATETRTWYWSPDAGEIKFIRHDTKEGLRTDIDVVSRSTAEL